MDLGEGEPSTHYSPTGTNTVGEKGISPALHYQPPHFGARDLPIRHFPDMLVLNLPCATESRTNRDSSSVPFLSQLSARVIFNGPVSPPVT